MKCPVCGGDCVSSAHDILATLSTVFAPCGGCNLNILDKRVPPDAPVVSPVCGCGKRFIDDVFVHCWIILHEEGVFSGEEPLSAVGMPLIHPGFAMRLPPFLPASSLVLLSRSMTRPAAERIVSEVPEVRGVVRTGDFTPGVTDPDLRSAPRTYDLLAGCDVRAGVFETPAGALVIYLQQSLLHIEFPRRYNPKIDSVARSVEKSSPRRFIDASCGAGTLGLCAARLGVPEVVMNDVWYAAAFWAAYNTEINSEFLAVENVRWHHTYEELMVQPVGGKPLLVADTEGEQRISVYQGDMFRLEEIMEKQDSLSALDLFNKEDKGGVERAITWWKEHIGGDVIIP